jgi:hypothetical protein
MKRSMSAPRARRTSIRAAAVLAALLLGVAHPRPAHADTFAPKGDDWKGSTLDLSKWHVTWLGDAQTQDQGIAVNDSTLKITAGGYDIWNDYDNGLFLWQPATGDFQATLEVRTLKMVASSTACGIMVRSSTDLHSPNVFCKTMIAGTHLQFRANVGDQEGPGSVSAGRLPWGDGAGNGPTMQLRLTRVGGSFTSARSFDGGVTWERLHDADHPDTDTVQVDMPDDVLVGIAVSAVNGDAGTTDATEAVLGPFTFTQTPTPSTTNGLIAVTAVDSQNVPVTDAALVIKDKDGKVVGSTTNDVTVTPTSDTGSFFLPPGAYTVETVETGLFAASVPLPFEITSGKAQDLLVPVGKPK